MNAHAMQKKRDLDIVLIHLPPWSVTLPPVGLAYLNTFLNSKGIRTEIIDLNIKLYNYSEKNKKHWDTIEFGFSGFDNILPELRGGIDKYISMAIESNAELIAIGVNKSSIGIADYICSQIKKRSKKKIIIGGYAAYLKAEVKKINLKNADYIAHPHSNPSLAAFIKYYYEKISEDFIGISNLLKACGKKNSPGFPGIYEIAKGNIKEGSGTFPANTILDIEYPRYEGFDLREYTTKNFSIILSTGCISKCKFCSDRNMFDAYRFREPENIFEEIEYLSKKDAEFIFFDDLAINGNPARLSRLCDLIIKKRLKVRWGGNAIPYSGLTNELITKMKKAGCYFLRFGVESGSDSLLKRMNKITSVADCERILEACTKEGIRTHINLIAGLPGETEEDFEKTLLFLRKNKDNIWCVANLHIAYISPKSEFEIFPSKYGLTLPGKDFFYYWHDDKGNTPELRKKRFAKIIKLCHELKIRMISLSAYDLSCQYKDVKKEIGKYISRLEGEQECVIWPKKD